MEHSHVLGDLTLIITEKLAVLEFGHPSSNSLNSSLLERLCATLEELSENEHVSAVLLQSTGDRAFCAGASFDELLQIKTAAESTLFFSGFAKLLNAMRTCKKPVIGRVHGKAVGGGVGLIAACDYVLASSEAAIRLSELSIGIAPLVIAPAVSRKIGISGLAALSLHPEEWKTADWALSQGLYSKVYTSRAELDQETERYAAALANLPAESLICLKSALWEGTDHWETLLFERAAITGKLALTETTQGILRKFKSKD